MQINIKKQGRVAGDLQEGLRKVIAQIGLGHKKGDGWAIDADPETEKREKGAIDQMTDDLGGLVASAEFITPEDIQTALKHLLKPLHDALRAEGYGSTDEELQALYGAPEKPEEAPEAPKEGDEKQETAGSTAEDTTTVGPAPKRWPWERNS